jgi:hypothetical protein
MGSDTGLREVTGATDSADEITRAADGADDITRAADSADEITRAAEGSAAVVFEFSEALLYLSTLCGAFRAVASREGGSMFGIDTDMNTSGLATFGR